MPRQRTNHSRRVYVLPDDFPQRLRRFGEESGLSWAEIARRIESYPLTIRRWRDDGVRPSPRHQMALLSLAESTPEISGAVAQQSARRGCHAGEPTGRR